MIFIKKAIRKLYAFCVRSIASAIGLLLSQPSKSRVQFIIFSKDRPMQLDLLLRSICEFAKPSDSIGNIAVVYRASTNNLSDDYKQLSHEYPSVSFLSQRVGFDFKLILIRLVLSSPNLICLLVDDNVFISSIDLTCPANILRENDSSTFSLRLGENIKYSYMLRTKTPPPSLTQVLMDHRVLSWSWRQGEGDWSYPMSLDGNIYSKRFLFPYLLLLNYRTPSQLESALASFASPSPVSYCFRQSSLINIPHSIVQTDFLSNRSMGKSNLELVSLYRDGRRISLDSITELQPYDSTHVELDYEFN